MTLALLVLFSPFPFCTVISHSILFLLFQNTVYSSYTPFFFIFPGIYRVRKANKGISNAKNSYTNNINNNNNNNNVDNGTSELGDKEQ